MDSVGGIPVPANSNYRKILRALISGNSLKTSSRNERQFFQRIVKTSRREEVPFPATCQTMKSSDSFQRTSPRAPLAVMAWAWPLALPLAMPLPLTKQGCLLLRPKRASPTLPALT